MSPSIKVSVINTELIPEKGWGGKSAHRGNDVIITIGPALKATLPTLQAAMPKNPQRCVGRYPCTVSMIHDIRSASGGVSSSYCI